MPTRCRSSACHGFTVIEMMTVVCVIGILVSLATLLYSRSLARARAIEGEAAVREVHRLETAYYGGHDSYTSDLAALGFSMANGMKYYTVSVTLGTGGSPLSYQVTATPAAAQNAGTWVLRQFQNGTTTVDRVGQDDAGGGTTADLSGGGLSPSGIRSSSGPRTVQTPASTGEPVGPDGGSGTESGPTGHAAGDTGVSPGGQGIGGP